LKRLGFALVFALCTHSLILFFLPSLLLKKPEKIVPKTKSIMITMSYIEPEIIKEPETIRKPPVIPQKKIPRLLEKKKVPLEKMEKVSAPILKYKKRELKKSLVKKEFLPPSKKVREQKTINNPSVEIPREKLQPVTPELKTPKPSRIKVQHPNVKKETLLQTKKKQPEKTIEDPIQIIRPEDPEYRNNPSPRYPKKAIKKGYQGLVELLVLISIVGLG